MTCALYIDKLAFGVYIKGISDISVSRQKLSGRRFAHLGTANALPGQVRRLRNGSPRRLLHEARKKTRNERVCITNRRGARRVRLHESVEDGARNRDRTGTTLQSRDFKSLVSTYFTIRAARRSRLYPPLLSTAETKKGKCTCTFPFLNHTHVLRAGLPINHRSARGYVEREKSLELSTYTLARYRSTN